MVVVVVHLMASRLKCAVLKRGISSDKSRLDWSQLLTRALQREKLGSVLCIIIVIDVFSKPDLVALSLPQILAIWRPGFIV